MTTTPRDSVLLWNPERRVYEFGFLVELEGGPADLPRLIAVPRAGKGAGDKITVAYCGRHEHYLAVPPPDGDPAVGATVRYRWRYSTRIAE
ncbi:DUF5988 family protein (plasmid) [Streptomyces sp. BI20]|uniref:DUF5988 family protein n=1 Tax=Streptomyces sp. BI20 TaxID=3403460 RepID=UPI003C78DBC2